MDIVQAKLLVALLLGTVRLVAGILPVPLYSLLQVWEEQEDGSKTINVARHNFVMYCVALVQSFGSGVLLATCFLHMMPDIYFTLEDLKDDGVMNTRYPYSNMVICIGFFLIYFIEEFSHWIVSQAADKPIKTRLKSAANSIRPIQAVPENDDPPPYKSKEFLRENDEDSGMSETLDIDEELKGEQYIYESLDMEETTTELERSISVQKFTNESPQKSTAQSELAKVVIQKEEIERIEKVAVTRQLILRRIFTVFALSLHAFVEGISIGVQKSVSNVWYLFTAVAVHSFTILFCVGMDSLLYKCEFKNILIYMLVLASTSPGGVLLGLSISLTSNFQTSAKNISVLLLEGVSTGTILYITFFESLKREKERRVFILQRSFCIIAGFSLMAILQYIKLE